MGLAHPFQDFMTTSRILIKTRTDEALTVLQASPISTISIFCIIWYNIQCYLKQSFVLNLETHRSRNFSKFLCLQGSHPVNFYCQTSLFWEETSNEFVLLSNWWYSSVNHGLTVFKIPNREPQDIYSAQKRAIKWILKCLSIHWFIIYLYLAFQLVCGLPNNFLDWKFPDALATLNIIS